MKQEAFDVARIMMNIPISLVIPDFVPVNIDGRRFVLFIREDVVGVFRSVHSKSISASTGSEHSDSENEWNAVSVESGDMVGSNWNGDSIEHCSTDEC